MVRFEAGSGGAGNKLKVDINDVMKYKISILDIQKIITREGVPRYDRGQEKRVWIMSLSYGDRPTDVQIIYRSGFNNFTFSTSFFNASFKEEKFL